MARNKIGFHAAVPGNLNGWGDYVRALDAAGIPAGVMSVGGGGVGDIIGCWEAGSTVPHVVGVRYMPASGQDVPPYGSDPRQAAVAWWGWLYPRIGNDVKAHRDKCWIVTGNELDKSQSDWLGRFYVELAGIMHAEGFKLCALNFSSGEPEPAHWETPGMLAYLELCANRPQDTAVGLHEYSYTTTDIFSKKVGDNQFVPMEPGDEYTLVGRFQQLHAVCDARGLRRPTILITEFGWQQETVPDVSTAMAHVAKAAALYAQHPNILWAGIWTLQNWHSGCIPNCVQALIAPIRDYTLTAVFPDPPPIDPPDPPDPPTPPPGGDNLLTNPSFEDGWYHVDGRPEFQIPNDWTFGYDVTTPNPYDNNPWSRYVAPEIRVIPDNQLPEHERPLFIFDGTYTLKAFKGNGAWWAWFEQEIALPAGTYTMTMPVFADLVQRYENGQKVWADDPDGRDGQYRIIVGQRGGEWGSLIPGQRNDLTREFAHNGGTIRVGLEIRCNFALMNSGVFTDAWTLTAVTEPQPTPCHGAAREPYNRTYWVASETNRAAIYALAATERRTVGPSYDDAGIGVGLTSKTAVVWDIAPSQHQQFIDWYALHYPGTAVQFRYLNGGTPPPPIPTAPSSVPCAGGSAREPYNRVYWVVAPDNPHAEEIYAQAASEARTIGPSYDDAGIGSGLTSKTAVLWDIPANRHAEFVAWYGEHYPETAVQFRNFAPSPGGQVFYEWPTSYYYVTQPFCVYNPEMYPASLNHRHEGIDVRSPYDTPYRAVAPGRVTWVSDRRQSDGQPSAYGWHVIIDLGWCTTLYAHMRPNPPVMVGQQVLAGQVLGLSGNTGNSTGPHCHLTVKIPGHVDGCGAATNYADPWEWLQPLYDNPPPPPQPHITGWLYTNNGGYLDQKPNGRAVVTSSANMRTSPSSGGTLLRQVQMGEIVIPDGRVQNGYHFVTAAGTGTEPPPSPDYEYNGPAVTFAPMIHAPADEWRWPTVNSMIAGLGIGVKFLSHGVNADFVGQYAGKKRICRLFWNNPAGDSVKTAQQKWDMDWGSDFGRMYNAGIRHFEIHNEPRLASEGFGRQWDSAAEWGNWLSQMVDIIKAQYPQAKLYYPGESPGLPWTDQFSFTNVAWPMVRGKMDGFCLHAYSGSSVFNTAVEEIVGQVLEAQAYLNLQVPLIVSESSVNRGVDYWHKANVYVEVEKRLNGVPGIEGVAWFISDWYNPPPDQAGNGESFYGTALPNHYMGLRAV